MTGAAVVTSGLAGLGSLAGGGMTAGLFVTAGAGAASSVFARSALALMSALDARDEIVKIHAEVLVLRWEGNREVADKLLRELRQLQAVADKEARLHSAVDEEGAKSQLARDWKDKERILGLAVEALA